MNKIKINQGFTLIELLVVVAIIGILTATVVISIQQVKAKARDSRRVTDINSISTALSLYHTDFNLYPVYDGYITGTDTLSTVLINAGTASALPTDPLNYDNYRYYYQSTDGSDYYLEYYLETDSVTGKSKGKNYTIP
jgi:prepilin-type N-terminal cleavage/methylation domain-containing protein